LKQPFYLGDWYVEPDHLRISRGDESAHLQPKMMAVLQVLVEREGQTVEKNELLDIVWHRQYVNEEVLKRVILKIRHVLGDKPRNSTYIETVHRRGYRLICAVKPAEERPQKIVRNWAGGSPFRSLNYFEFSDSDIFFGRSTAVDEARDALAEQRDRKCGFLLISGASGIGKSSFARAGLVPTLLKERRLGIDDISILRPTDLLNAPHNSSLGRIMASIDHEQVEDAQAGQATPILVIDQFEEALALDNCLEIMDLVHQLARSGLLDVIVTMREDFIPVLNDWPAIARLKQGAGTFTLGIPSQSELAEILQGPARMAGFQYETSDQYGSLKREILSKASNVAQALPLMQFLLHRMYEDREEQLLTWESYHRQGGLVGAISVHADKVMAGLPAPLADALPGLLEQLTQFDLDHQRITRHSAPMNKIASNPHHVQLAVALVDARLLTIDTHADGYPYLSLVHETLLEHWDIARIWAEENFERLAAYRRTQIAYGNWQQGGKSSDLLLRAGKALADGQSVRLLAGLDEGIQGFIEQSRAQMQRFRRIKLGALAMLVVLTLVSVASSFLANHQRLAAEENLNLAKRSTNFVIGLFNTTSPNTTAEPLTARQMLDEGVRRIPLEFAQDDASRAQLLHATGRLYMQMGELNRAEELLSLALQATPDGQREKYEYAWALAEVGNLRNKDLADKQEDDLLKLAISSLESSGATEGEIASAYWRAARQISPEWRFSPHYWERAYRYYDSEAFAHNRESPEMLAQFAVVLAYWRSEPVNLRDPERALSLVARSLAMYKFQQREEEPAYLRTLETGAALESSLGSTLRGIELQRRAAEGSTRVLGRLHIATAFRWQVLGDYLLNEGFYAEASQALQQATEMYLESYGDETPRWFEANLSIAETWFYSGKHEEAGKLLDVLDTRQERAWGIADHPETWRLWQLRGHLSRSKGNLAEASSAYKRAMELITPIAARSDVILQKIALELDFLSTIESTRLSAYSRNYLDTVNAKRQAKGIEYWHLPYQKGLQRPRVEMLVKLLHNNCNTIYAEQAVFDLNYLAELAWENDVWQRYVSANELAHCGYRQLDLAELRDNAEAVARMTHPSTFMAIEAKEMIDQQPGIPVVSVTP